MYLTYSRLKYFCLCIPTPMVRVQVLLGSQIVTPTHTLPVPLLLPTWVSIPLTICQRWVLGLGEANMAPPRSRGKQSLFPDGAKSR